MAGSLQKKRVIITGGASGIGAAAVKAFLDEGASVAVFDVNDDMADGLISGLSKDSPCRYFHCDIGTRLQVGQCVQAAISWLGGLDVLVNAGGIILYGNAAEFTDEQWDRIFDINVRGTMLTNQAAFHHLRTGGGSIINLGSMSGIRPHAGNAAYSATKGAVMAWTRSIAAEWGGFNIRANCVAPVAHTPMADVPPPGMNETDQQGVHRALAQQIPLGRMGDPDADIAPVLLFLASDASRYMTGQVISVDGGTVMLGS